MLKLANPEEAKALYERLKAAITTIMPNIIRGKTRHNLEQYWWKKISLGEELPPNFIDDSERYVEDQVNVFTKPLIEATMESMQVSGEDLVYSFPFKEEDLLGEFTLPVPTEMVHPISGIKDLSEEDLSGLLLLEYSKWFGIHILP